MNSHHIIEEACFDIVFATESEAFSQQEPLTTLIKGVLLKEIDDAFSYYADKDQAVIRIDQLEIDLGEVSYVNYPYEMKQRLRERLREQLQQRLQTLRMQERPCVKIVGNEVESDQITMVKQLSIDLEVMRSYLQFGYLPWNYQGEKESEIQPLFMRLVETQGDELVSFLFSLPERGCVVDRLIDMLPPFGVSVLVQRLMGHRSNEIQTLVEMFSNAHWVSGCLRNIDRRDRASCHDGVFCFLLKLLLRPGMRYQSLIEIANELAFLCGGDGSSVLSGVCLVRATHPTYEGLLEQSSSGDSGARKNTTVIKSFNDDDKLSVADVVEILTNSDLTHEGFIEQSTSSDSGVRKKAIVVESFNDDDKLSTVDLVEILFNSAPVKSRLRRAHQTNSISTAESIAHTAHPTPKSFFVPSFNGDSGISKKSVAVESLSDDEKLYAADLIEIFTNGDPGGLKIISSQWHHVLTVHAKLLERLLMVHGKKRLIRRRLIQEFSSPQLSELIGLIAPRVSEFVKNTVALFNGGQLACEKSAEVTPGEKTAHSALSSQHNLWNFTFEFFFVERGNRFNKKEYCGSLLRKMAVQNNCAYAELLIAMQQWLSSVADHSSHVTELQSIMDELVELPQTQVVTEQEHALYPYAECLLIASEKARHKEYSQFYRRYLSAGQLLSPDVFVRMFADFLVDDAECDPNAQYVNIISSLKKNHHAKRPIEQKVIAVLSEIVRRNDLNDVVTADDESLLSEMITVANTDALYVKNAGQVLLAPYIPMLFERLGLVKTGHFTDHDAALRGVHALQYMVDGEGTSPEYRMVLNKLICGVQAAHAVTRKIVLTEKEKAVIDGLLTAAIENWKSVGSTSVAGLRESFLQREGRLQHKNKQWHLLVESRSYDMLLDQLPWSYSTIKYAWMSDVILVEWR